MGYLLLADSHTYVCQTWDDLAAKLIWAREEGYRTAKARANGWVDRMDRLCPGAGTQP